MRKLRWDRTAMTRNALVALILLSLTLAIHEVFGEHGLLALRRQKREYESLQQQIHQLQKENQQLEHQVKGLKSDPKAIERLAREQMKMARPGEVIFTLPEKKGPPPSPDPIPK